MALKKTHYIYGHWTEDTNELFYIGVGTRKDRMYSSHDKNDYWNKIVDKHGYNVEIIVKGLTCRDEAVKEEVRLQILNKPRGCMVYGDRLNKIVSDETKAKMSVSAKARGSNNTGYKHTDSARANMSNGKSTPVKNCRGDIYTNSYTAATAHGTYSSHISKTISGKRQSSGKYSDGNKIIWSKVS